MALDLRANTAVDVLIGPFVDSTDGNATEDGLTLTQADIKLSKNGQALTQKTDATAAAFDDDGYYNCELDATDTNTEGTLVLIVHESGALPVRHEYNIMAEAAWDSLYIAKDTGFMDVNVKAVSEDTTAADNLESACDNYSVTRGLSGTALPAAAADAAGGLVISDAGGWDADELYDAIITDAAGANIAVDIIAVKAETALIVADTNELQTDDYPTSIAAIKAETALIVADTNELQTDDIPGTLATIDGIVDNILIDTGTTLETHLTDIKGGTFAGATDSLEAIRDRGDAEWITGAGGDATEAKQDTIIANVATVDGIVDNILTDTGITLDALIKDVPTVAEFEARTIVSADYVVVGDTLARVTLVDTVTTNTDLNTAQAEPGQGAPAVNATPLSKLAYIYKAWRNKKDNDGTTRNLYADDASTVDQKSGVGEAAGTVTTDEWESGP